MLLEIILTLERMFQCLIVPHSNTIIKETSMSNWKSDDQNDMDEMVHFTLQA